MVMLPIQSALTLTSMAKNSSFDPEDQKYFCGRSINLIIQRTRGALKFGKSSGDEFRDYNNGLYYVRKRRVD
jgi:hypothetical protein